MPSPSVHTTTPEAPTNPGSGPPAAPIIGYTQTDAKGHPLYAGQGGYNLPPGYVAAPPPAKSATTTPTATTIPLFQNTGIVPPAQDGLSNLLPLLLLQQQQGQGGGKRRRRKVKYVQVPVYAGQGGYNQR